MNSITLWTLDRSAGKYLVEDDGGTVLLGPFFSHRDPAIVGQRLANSTNRRVTHRSLAATSDDMLIVFLPTSPRES